MGHSPVFKEIIELPLCMARENPTSNYDRIQGARANLGRKISDSTVANILKEHRIEPAPDRRRQSNWKDFLQAYWDFPASVDFATIEVWTKSGPATLCMLFVMELATRVHFRSYTASPDESWMCHAARKLSDTILHTSSDLSKRNALSV